MVRWQCVCCRNEPTVGSPRGLDHWNDWDSEESYVVSTRITKVWCIVVLPVFMFHCDLFSKTETHESAGHGVCEL